MAGREETLQQLLDVEALKALKARHLRLMDSKEWDLLEALFADDALFEIPDGGIAERGPKAISRAVRMALDKAVTSHQAYLPEIEITGKDTALATWAMFDYVEFPGPGEKAPTGIKGYGHYHEEYVREDGEWRIKALRLSRLRVDPLPGGYPEGFIA